MYGKNTCIFTTIFDDSCNLHEVSQGAVTKQERQHAILTFYFINFPEDGQLI